MQSVDLMLGQPTLVRYNYFTDWKRAIAFNVGYHFEEWYYIGADYNFYFYNIKDRLKKKNNFFNSLLFYVGPGVFLGSEPDAKKSDEKVKIGTRLAGGAEYLFTGTNLSMKIEFAPAYFFKGDDDFGFQGMVGLAYYFAFPNRKVSSRAEPLKIDTSEEEDKEFEMFD